ncbi:MAG: T9SS type A sorting domain-containing protein [Bacteroidia bacterium]|nr:T9SS type A sorting domain-containing protein [Bacteroidia bacterium]
MDDKGIIVVSSSNIQAYYENQSPNGGEIFTLKGRAAVGKDFLVPSSASFGPVSSSTALRSIDIINLSAATNSITIVDGSGTPVVTNWPLSSPGQTYSFSDRNIDNFRVISTDNIAVTVKEDLLEHSIANPYAWCIDNAGDQLIPRDSFGYRYIITKEQLDGEDLRFYTYSTTPITVNIKVNNGVPQTKSISRTSPANFNMSNLPHGAFIDIYSTNCDSFLVYHTSGRGCEIGSAIIPRYNFGNGSKRVVIGRGNLIPTPTSPVFKAKIVSNHKNVRFYDYLRNIQIYPTLTWNTLTNNILNAPPSYVAEVDLTLFTNHTSRRMVMIESDGIMQVGVYNSNTQSIAYGFSSAFSSVYEPSTASCILGPDTVCSLDITLGDICYRTPDSCLAIYGNVNSVWGLQKLDASGNVINWPIYGWSQNTVEKEGCLESLLKRMFGNDKSQYPGRYRIYQALKTSYPCTDVIKESILFKDIYINESYTDTLPPKTIELCSYCPSINYFKKKCNNDKYSYVYKLMPSGTYEEVLLYPSRPDYNGSRVKLTPGVYYEKCKMDSCRFQIQKIEVTTVYGTSIMNPDTLVIQKCFQDKYRYNVEFGLDTMCEEAINLVTILDLQTFTTVSGSGIHYDYFNRKISKNFLLDEGFYEIIKPIPGTCNIMAQIVQIKKGPYTVEIHDTIYGQYCTLYEQGFSFDGDVICSNYSGYIEDHNEMVFYASSDGKYEFTKGTYDFYCTDFTTCVVHQYPIKVDTIDIDTIIDYDTISYCSLDPCVEYNHCPNFKFEYIVYNYDLNDPNSVPFSPENPDCIKSGDYMVFCTDTINCRLQITKLNVNEITADTVILYDTISYCSFESCASYSSCIGYRRVGLTEAYDYENDTFPRPFYPPGTICLGEGDYLVFCEDTVNCSYVITKLRVNEIAADTIVSTDTISLCRDYFTCSGLEEIGITYTYDYTNNTFPQPFLAPASPYMLAKGDYLVFCKDSINCQIHITELHVTDDSLDVVNLYDTLSYCELTTGVEYDPCQPPFDSEFFEYIGPDNLPSFNTCEGLISMTLSEGNHRFESINRNECKKYIRHIYVYDTSASIKDTCFATHILSCDQDSIDPDLLPAFQPERCGCQYPSSDIVRKTINRVHDPSIGSMVYDIVYENITKCEVCIMRYNVLSQAEYKCNQFNIDLGMRRNPVYPNILEVWRYAPDSVCAEDIWEIYSSGSNTPIPLSSIYIGEEIESNGIKVLKFNLPENFVGKVCLTSCICVCDTVCCKTICEDIFPSPTSTLGGIKDYESNELSQFEIKPNPTNFIFQIIPVNNHQAQNTMPLEKVQIFNSIGKLVLVREGIQSDYIYNLSGLPSGTYVVEITSQGKTQNLRVILVGN